MACTVKLPRLDRPRFERALTDTSITSTARPYAPREADFPGHCNGGYSATVNDVFDVIVIGGGVAGAAAAVSAARAGARAALVSARPGATALCSGAWRGSLPSEFAHLLAETGYYVVAAPTELPWLDGGFRNFDECHAAHAIEWGERTLVCGIVGLPLFHATVLARCWQPRVNGDIATATIELPETPAAGWAPASLARFIERHAARFGELLAPHVRSARADAVMLPAIIGVDAAEATRNAIENVVGARIVELAGGTPSLPGWRLRRSLRAALERAGVTVVNGAATTSAREARRANSITIAVADGSETRLDARSFVLATGKFVGGGIIADGAFSEPVFDLPVWVDHLGERFETVNPLALTSAQRSARQPLLFAGVAADDTGRPVDAHDNILLENVFVAGAVRAAWDGSGMNLGHVATDGWAAGARAAA